MTCTRSPLAPNSKGLCNRSRGLWTSHCHGWSNKMWSYILRRLLFGIPTLLGVTVIVFTLLHLAPGDPVSAMVPSDAPLELVLMIKEQMGLDKPLPVQYWRWLTRVAHGD